MSGLELLLIGLFLVSTTFRNGICAFITLVALVICLNSGYYWWSLFLFLLLCSYTGAFKK